MFCLHTHVHPARFLPFYWAFKHNSMDVLRLPAGARIHYNQKSRPLWSISAETHEMTCSCVVHNSCRMQRTRMCSGDLWTG